jgi:glucosylceramidase
MPDEQRTGCLITEAAAFFFRSCRIFIAGIHTHTKYCCMNKLFFPLGILMLFSFVIPKTNRPVPKVSSADSFVTKDKRIVVYTTADSTSLRITPTDTLSFSEFGQPLETQPCVFIDPSKTFQTFIGIGGALTDAAAETYAKLPKDKQQEIMQAYFDPVKGIGYTLARTNIQSCDFSSSSYTYVKDNDTALKTFSVAHDEQYRIPFIREAISHAGGKLTLFASPWSPPAWMKTNNSMLHGGKLKPAFYQSWADYYVKFIQAYAHHGIPVWGLTVQNEPMAVQTWESCN